MTETPQGGKPTDRFGARGGRAPGAPDSPATEAARAETPRDQFPDRDESAPARSAPPPPRPSTPPLNSQPSWMMHQHETGGPRRPYSPKTQIRAAAVVGAVVLLAVLAFVPKMLIRSPHDDMPPPPPPQDPSLELKRREVSAMDSAIGVLKNAQDPMDSAVSSLQSELDRNQTDPSDSEKTMMGLMQTANSGLSNVNSVNEADWATDFPQFSLALDDYKRALNEFIRKCDKRREFFHNEVESIFIDHDPQKTAEEGKEDQDQQEEAYSTLGGKLGACEQVETGLKASVPQSPQ